MNKKELEKKSKQERLKLAKEQANKKIDNNVALVVNVARDSKK